MAISRTISAGLAGVLTASAILAFIRVYNYNMYGAQPRQVAGEDGAYDLIVNPRVDPIN